MSGRRILVLVGTDHHGFDRAVTWADTRQRAHPDDDVLVQHGRTAAPGAARGAAFLTPAELRAEVALADVVITHGGPGTISDARRGGHRPLVFPRDPAFGEHVDDHQRRFAPWCAERGLVHVAMDPAALDDHLAALPPHGTRLVERMIPDGPISPVGPVGTDRAESTVGIVGSVAVATFAALLAAPPAHRRTGSASDAPRVLVLCGSADPTDLEQRLAARPGTLVLGSVLRDWPAAVAGSGACSCGHPLADCPLWSQVGERALTSPSSGLPTRPVGTGHQRAGRRHPGRSARESLLAFAVPHRRTLAAACEVAQASLVVVRADVDETLALSHDRHLDLRVADLGLSVRDRWALRHRRVPVERWPAGSGATAFDHLDDWAPARPGWTGHHPVAALSPTAWAATG